MTRDLILRMMPVMTHNPHRPKPPGESIAKNLAHYTPSVFFRAGVGILNTLVRPKLLTPQWFGLWSLLNVIPSYASYLHLGARDYLRFKVPRLQAQGEEQVIHEVEASVFWGSFVPNLGVTIALICIAIFGPFEKDLRIGLGTMALLVSLTCLYEYCTTLMKAHQLFRDLSIGMYIRNASQLILSVLLMYHFGIYGLFIAVPAAFILGLLFLRTRYPFHLTGSFSWPVYTEMVREGLPLTIFAFLMTFMITSGRLLVASYLTTEEVGYYALATLALRGMLTFPGAAREVVEPRIMEAAGVRLTPEDLTRYLYRPLVLNACYLPLMIAPLYFLLPPIIESLLPLYSPGIPALRVILFGFYFLAVFYPLRGIIVAHNLQRQAALLMALNVLINIALSLLALEGGFGILGVAVANTVSYAAVLVLMATLLHRTQGTRFPLGQIWPVLTAFPLLCSGIWAIQTWLEPWVGIDLFGGIIQSAIFLISGVLLITLAERAFSLLQGTSPLSILTLFLRTPPKPS